MDNRNYLARLRTQMANERTLMSYLRGALALVGLAAFIFKFYDAPVFWVLSGISLVTGLSLGIYGMIRYRKYKQKLLRRDLGE